MTAHSENYEDILDQKRQDFPQNAINKVIRHKSDKAKVWNKILL